MFPIAIASTFLRNRIRNQIFILLFSGCLVSLAVPVQAVEDTCKNEPAIASDPQTVVQTVIEALRTNDNEDNGIATVYCLASPSNKKMTGPFERFASMIKEGYADMLNHRNSEFEKMEVRENVALQPVWLTTPDGVITGYMFRLGKQADGQFSGMWMTDAVYRLDTSERQQSI